MVQETHQDGHLETMETYKNQTGESTKTWSEEIQGLGVGKHKERLLAYR